MPAVASPTRHVCIAAADRTMAAAGSGHAGPTAPWTLPSSLLLHILLFGIVIAMPQQRWVRPQQEKILVRILTPQQYRAATAGDDPQAVTRGPEPVYASPSPDRFGTLPATPPIPRKPEPPAMIRAVKILSGEALADARSRQARIALRQLSDFDRREQLCNLEALEQVHAWDGDYEPERLVAYAM